jgi:hypothetical protein
MTFHLTTFGLTIFLPNNIFLSTTNANSWPLSFHKRKPFAQFSDPTVRKCWKLEFPGIYIIDTFFHSAAEWRELAQEVKIKRTEKAFFCEKLKN